MEALFSLQHLKSEHTHALDDHSSLIGRSVNCDVQVDHETLSREHARISIRDSDITVQDLHSTNGTFVNERQIYEATPISAGDVIRFGQESFCLQQRDMESTVVFDRAALSHNASSMLVEDEEDEDGTMMLQSIALPAGWSEPATASPQLAFSKEDLPLIVALKAHARKKLAHPHGLLITIAQEGNTPSVKLLSTDRPVASWNVGRGQGHSLQLDDARVSSNHAQLNFHEEAWEFIDTQSRNGSFIKGSKVSTHMLKDITTVNIGPFSLTFESIKKT